MLNYAFSINWNKKMIRVTLFAHHHEATQTQSHNLLSPYNHTPYNIKPEGFVDLWQLMQYEWVYLYSDSFSLPVTITSVVCKNFLKMISRK